MSLLCTKYSEKKNEDDCKTHGELIQEVLSERPRTQSRPDNVKCVLKSRPVQADEKDGNSVRSIPVSPTRFVSVDDAEQSDSSATGAAASTPPDLHPSKGNEIVPVHDGVQGVPLEGAARDGPSTEDADREALSSNVQSGALRTTSTVNGNAVTAARGSYAQKLSAPGDWHVVNNQNRNNKRRNQNRLVGQAQNTGLLAAPMPSRDFFISRVNKNVTVDQLGAYIKSKGVEYRNLIKTNHADAVHGSFRLTISLSDVKNVQNAAFWPKDLWVRKWRIHNDNEKNGSIQDKSTVAV